MAASTAYSCRSTLAMIKWPTEMGLGDNHVADGDGCGWHVHLWHAGHLGRSKNRDGDDGMFDLEF
jgi:hypothetical protein